MLLILVVLIVWAAMSFAAPGVLENPNAFLKRYNAIFLSLGTIFVVSVIAIYTTYLAGWYAERRDRVNRSISAQLKLAEFRQIWISEMRNDISELLRLSYSPESAQDVAKAYGLSMKIEMRLNPAEPLAMAVSESLLQVSETSGNDAKHHLALSNLTVASRKYLKAEWKRLKEDIASAQILGSE
ncbi:hypothetical protein AB2B41_01135 [Marimonas sp. MJW-29]|uniref:Uncharacterized protein n=1 Tax=Sulfitobacter sediminis TaxID=3234186 RepID=A0ABV3RGV4_9RHOB